MVDDYALAYKKITELVTATGAPASGDFVIRYDTNTGGPVKVDPTNLVDFISVSGQISLSGGSEVTPFSSAA